MMELKKQGNTKSVNYLPRRNEYTNNKEIQRCKILL